MITQLLISPYMHLSLVEGLDGGKDLRGLAIFGSLEGVFKRASCEVGVWGGGHLVFLLVIATFSSCN